MKDGWAPLCQFLGVPEPPAGTPFPRVNDTASMEAVRLYVQRMAWLVIVLLPAAILLATWHFEMSSSAVLMMAVGYGALLAFLRFVANGISHLNEEEEKKNN